MGNEIIEQKSAAWHESRKMRITGSRVGAILGLSPWQKPDAVIREMVRGYHGAETEFKGNPATDHGNNNEALALLCFMRESGLSVEQCGFFAYGDRMGASPDGLTDDGGVLELKVPYGIRKGGDFKPLEAQPHYAAQIQMEMLATGRKHAYFAQYIAPKGDPLDGDYIKEAMLIERVEFDDAWIDTNHGALDAFYQRLLAELDNPAHLEPLRVSIDTGEAGAMLMELDEIRQRKKADEAREKELIAELVKMAGEKDALIHGRPLTRVERVGSVDYGKVPELAGVDLNQYRKKGSSFWRFS